MQQFGENIWPNTLDSVMPTSKVANDRKNDQRQVQGPNGRHISDRKIGWHFPN